MKALLLAAGVGSRLERYAKTVPKCMVPVAGTPPLLRLIAWLRDEGVTDLAINLHHLPAVVTGAVGDGSALGVRVRYSREPELLGTAGALDPLRDWIGDEPFLVVYADNIVCCCLAGVADLHRRTAATITVALFHRDDVSTSGAATVDDGGRISRFVEKPSVGGPGWVSAGLLHCEPSVLEIIPGGGAASDFGRDVLPALLAAGATLAGYKLGVGEYLYWIDTPADLAQAEAQLADQGEAT